MSEDEVEAFEITDYDLANEFNIERPIRGLSKKEQIYGIWADDSGDEGPSQRKGFGGINSSKSGRKNYTAPVSFVAGGIQQSGKNKEKINEEEDDGNSNEEDDEEDKHRSSSESSEENDQHTTFRNLSKNNIDGDIAGLRKKRHQFNPILANKGVGHWERHTKGIGAKLLLQMGFQPGKGLGKDLQGIQAPIEASLRKGRGAIGAYGPEKSQKIADLPTNEKKTEEKDKISQWRKEDGTSKKKKVRYVYKSIEDVLDQSKQSGKKKREFNELSKVKVIDMTGPEKRILSGYHAISSVQKPSDQWEIRKDKKFVNFELPELQHNLNLLVDMCEEAIVLNDKSLRYAEDRRVALEAEVDNLNIIDQQESATIATLEKVMDIIQKIVDGADSNTLTLNEASEAFVELKEKYYTEYCSNDLASLAISVIRPLLKAELATWSPLVEPSKPLSVFQQWKSVLGQDTAHRLSISSNQDPFHCLLWDSWMPSIRVAINAWQCREWDRMIELIEVWTPLLPSWILDNIVQQLILPHLQREVEAWNPLTDTVPIHTWIHPWLPLLGKHLSTTIFPIIRHKLSSALVSWHPSDCSARLMLQPWSGVFSQGEFDGFLVNNIVPKLQQALQEFVINPHQQHLDNWNWVMEWSELVPVHIMASLLDKSFFPKWLQVLTLWLNLSPNYDQVTNWYTGWKNIIPSSLKAQPVIKEHLRSALDLMNHAVGGKVSQPQVQAETTGQSKYQGMSSESVRTATQMPQSFKDLVQKRCEERGIVWVPLQNRFREGKKVYRCGNVQVYVDRNVLFVCDSSGRWDPVSINALLDMAV